MRKDQGKNGDLKLKLEIQNLFKRLKILPSYMICNALWGRDYHVFLSLLYFTIDSEREDFFQQCLKHMARFAFDYTSANLHDRIFIADHMSALMPDPDRNENGRDFERKYSYWLTEFYMLLLQKIRSEYYSDDDNLHRENVAALKQLIKLIFSTLSRIADSGQETNVLLDKAVQLLVEIDPDPQYGYREFKDEIREFARWIGTHTAKSAQDWARDWFLRYSSHAPNVCRHIAEGINRVCIEQQGEITAALAWLKYTT